MSIAFPHLPKDGCLINVKGFVDGLEQTLPKHRYVAFLKAQAIQHLWYFHQKSNNQIDLDRCIWYLQRLQTVLSESVEEDIPTLLEELQ